MGNRRASMERKDGLGFRFWGVRGSIASPGPDTQRYGGNTACLEVWAGEHRLIFDGGTGLRRLGATLMAQANRHHIHLFLSHLHWDHIQGIPFFAPAFQPQNELCFYGERKGEYGLQALLEGQMRSPNFPIPLSVMRAKLSFRELTAGEMLAFEGGVMVKTIALNHPNGCLGFRIELGDRAIVFCTDTEHDPSGALSEELLEFARGAQAFIYDSMYTEEEYQAGRIGWGHSTFEEALRIAEAAGVERLFFFHHDPDHNDLFLDEKLKWARGQCLQRNLSFQVEMAREGDMFSL